ncbi:MAG: fumarylacetoacetate hydrolase family protein [Chloroflexi bacterium]|nr:fumarylacetoacetate hydrolase family protein [Chloroflexota bacterium]
MKILRYDRGGNQAYGVLEGDSVRAIQGDICGDFQVGDEECKLDQVKLVAPVQPGIVVGDAMGFPGKGHDHVKEPLIFFKAASSVIGHLENIIIPASCDFLEAGAELAVVMAREARSVPEDKALKYVLGYTCAFDVAGVDLIQERVFMAKAKSHYTFTPLGPVIATDLDSTALTMKFTRNGVLELTASTGDMLFGVARVISFISEFMALQPLDVVLMGMPPHSPQTTEGDVLELEISGIGTLRNRVVKG